MARSRIPILATIALVVALGAGTVLSLQQRAATVPAQAPTPTTVPTVYATATMTRVSGPVGLGAPHVKGIYSGTYFRSVNLYGMIADLCCGNTVANDVTPSTAFLTWALNHGFYTFRVPISWAALQPTFLGALDPTYLGLMDTLVTRAAANGQRVAFVLMDKRNGSAAIPIQADVVDLYNRLSSHYANTTGGFWGYDLFNEPGQDSNGAWNKAIVPALINTIRANDMSHTIVVESDAGGYGYTFDTGDAGNAMPYKDIGNNLLYEAHFYGDTPPNGTYPTPAAVPTDTTAMASSLSNFTGWCSANSVPCMAGEYGVPGGWVSGNNTCITTGSNPSTGWETVLGNFLTTLDTNHINGTYWEAGPYSDVNSVGPVCDSGGGVSGTSPDMPQMATLQSHAGTTNLPPTSYSDAYVPSTTNLLSNSGFETGAASPWGLSGTASIGTGNAHAGTYSASIKADSYSSNLYITLPSMTAYLPYVFGCWVKGPSGDTAKIGPNPGTTTFTTLTGSWQFAYTYLSSLTTTSSTTMGLFATSTSGTDTTYWDDCQLVQTSQTDAIGAATATPYPSNTPTVGPTNTPGAPTNTPTATNTPVPPTNTPTNTATPVPPTNTPTATNTATPTATNTAGPGTPTSTPGVVIHPTIPAVATIPALATIPARATIPVVATIPV